MDLLLHDVPETVDQALRERAEAAGTTVDAVAVDVLTRGLDAPRPAGGPPYHDLDWFFGGGCMDEATLAALAELDVVHVEHHHKVDEMLAAEAARSAVPSQP